MWAGEIRFDRQGLQLFHLPIVPIRVAGNIFRLTRWWMIWLDRPNTCTREGARAAPGNQADQHPSDRIHAGGVPNLHGRFGSNAEVIRIFSTTDHLSQVRQSTRNLASRSVENVRAADIVCLSGKTNYRFPQIGD